MIRKMMFFAAVVLMAVPGVMLVAESASMASDGGQPSAQVQCMKLKASMGAQAFSQAYASFGACVSRLAPVDQDNTATAQSQCKVAQADANFAASHGGKTFDQYYGTNANKSDAFGKCISTQAQVSATTEEQVTPNPAQTCRTARTSLGTAAFDQLYVTNASKSNAFGKCVSKTAQAQTTNEVNVASQCRTDASVTSSTEPNAFGKCVAAKSPAASAKQEQTTINAAKTCYSQLKSIGVTAFKVKYATFGSCVSQEAKV